jgi:hypothetical protein
MPGAPAPSRAASMATWRPAPCPTKSTSSPPRSPAPGGGPDTTAICTRPSNSPAICAARAQGAGAGAAARLPPRRRGGETSSNAARSFPSPRVPPSLLSRIVGAGSDPGAHGAARQARHAQDWRWGGAVGDARREMRALGEDLWISAKTGPPPESRALAPEAVGAE